MPRRAAISGPPEICLPSKIISTFGHGVGAENRARDFAASRSNQSAQADDLAFAYLEIDVCDAGQRRDALDFEQYLAGFFRKVARIGHVHGSTNHHTHKLIWRHIGGAHLVDTLPVA